MTPADVTPAAMTPAAVTPAAMTPAAMTSAAATPAAAEPSQKLRRNSAETSRCKNAAAAVKQLSGAHPPEAIEPL